MKHSTVSKCLLRLAIAAPLALSACGCGEGDSGEGNATNGAPVQNMKLDRVGQPGAKAVTAGINRSAIRSVRSEST